MRNSRTILKTKKDRVNYNMVYSRLFGLYKLQLLVGAELLDWMAVAEGSGKVKIQRNPKYPERDNLLNWNRHVCNLHSTFNWVIHST